MAANWETIAHFFALYSGGYFLVIVASFAIQIFWIWMIARKRQSWARWPSVVVIAIVVLMTIFNAKTMFKTNPVAEIIKIAIYLLWIIEFSLLFTKEAKAWFVFPPSPASEGEAVSPTEA